MDNNAINFNGLSNKEFAIINANKNVLCFGINTSRQLFGIIAGWYGESYILIKNEANGGYHILDYGSTASLVINQNNNEDRYIYASNDEFIFITPTTQIINIKEYLQKYKGRKIIITDEHSILAGEHGKIIDDVVNGRHIFIELENKNLNTPGCRVITSVINDKLKTCKVHIISPHFLKLAKEYSQQKPYPNICRFCKSKALIKNTMIFCSNARCKKSRNKIKEKIKYVRVIDKTKDKLSTKDIFIYCPKCNERAVYTSGIINDNDITMFMCTNQHRFPNFLAEGYCLGSILDRGCMRRTNSRLSSSDPGHTGWVQFRE